MSECILNAAMHLTVVSFLGAGAVIAGRRLSAPLRAQLAWAFLIALPIVLAGSLLFHTQDWFYYRTSFVAAVADSRKVPAPPSVTVLGQGNVSQPAAQRESEPARQSTATIDTLPLVIQGFGILWILGAALGFLKILYGLVYLKGYRSGLKEVVDESVDQLLARAPSFGRSAKIYLSPTLKTPVATGIITPVILLPEPLYHDLSTRELSAILQHESAHLAHGDPLTGLLQDMIIALNWWNPLVRFIGAEYAIAREEVCDNSVIAGNTPPRDYAECLINLAEKTCLVSRLPATSAMANPHMPLGRRIRGLLSKERNLATTVRRRHALLIFVPVLLGALSLAGIRSSLFALERPDVTAGTPMDYPALFTPAAREIPSVRKALREARQTFLGKFKVWELLNDGLGEALRPDQVKAALVAEELIQGLTLVRFKPAGDFDPQTPGQFLKQIRAHSQLFSERRRLGTGFFRTTNDNGLYIGSFLTEYPHKMKAELHRNPHIDFVSMEKVTPELFSTYVHSKQEVRKKR